MRNKLVLTIGIVVVLAGLAAGWWFFGRTWNRPSVSPTQQAQQSHKFVGNITRTDGNSFYVYGHYMMDGSTGKLSPKTYTIKISIDNNTQFQKTTIERATTKPTKTAVPLDFSKATQSTIADTLAGFQQTLNSIQRLDVIVTFKDDIFNQNNTYPAETISYTQDVIK